MRVKFDPEADAVYIYFADEMPPVALTYPCDPEVIRGMVNLDFDARGRLIGVEVLDARKKLPKELLNNATVALKESKKRKGSKEC